MVDSVGIFGNEIYELYVGGKYTSDGYLFGTVNVFGLVNRISLLHPLMHTAEMTPDLIPYWKGETYKPIFSSWVPRALWQDKPREKIGDAFGFRYSFLSERDRGMSVNLPWVTELYANFGRWGVLIGMSLVGAFMGFLDRFFNSPDRNPLELAAGTAIFLPLFYQESNFSLMTGSLVPLTICMWVYFRVGLRVLRWRR